MRFFRTVTAVAASLAMWSAVSAAQASFGRLAGTVFDSTGSRAPGRRRHVDQRADRSGADRDGDTEVGAFLFPQVQPGLYTVTMTLAGFAARLHGRRNRRRRRAIADGAAGSGRSARR